MLKIVGYAQKGFHSIGFWLENVFAPDLLVVQVLQNNEKRKRND
jgi:hypothetical protein